MLGHTGRFFLALPALLVVGVLWLLSSQAGSQFVLDRVSGLTDGMVEIGKVQPKGHLLGTLLLDQVAVRTPTVEVDIRQLRIRWSPLALLALRAQVDALSAAEVDVRLIPAPSDSDQPSDGGPPPSRLPVNVMLRALSVAKLSVTDRNGATQAVEDIELQASWLGERVRITRLTARNDMTGPVALVADARLSPQQITLDALALAAPFKLEASGHYAYAGSFNADTRWENLQWPLVGDSPQVRSGVGHLVIDGDLSAYTVAMKGDLSTPDYAGDITLNGTGSAAHLQLAPLEIRALDGSALAQGTVTWDPALLLDIEADVDNLDLAAVLPDWPGRITGAVHAEGGLNADNPLQFSADIRDSTLRGYPLSLTARGGWQGETLTLTSAELRQGRSRISATGTAWPRLDLTATLDSPNLTALWPDLSGTLQLQAQINGAPSFPSVRFSGKGSDIAWADRLQTGRLNFAGLLAPEGPMELTLDLADISGAATVTAIRTELRGRTGEHTLSLVAELPQGAFELQLSGALNPETLAWRGQLTRADLKPDRLPALALRAPADLRLSAAASTLAPACWDSDPPAQVGLCLNADIAPDRTRARADLERFDYGVIAAFLPPRWRLEGEVAGHADIAINGDAAPTLDIDLQTAAGGLDIGRQAAIEFRPGHIRVLDGAEGLTLDVDLPTSQGGIRITGTGSPGLDWLARSVDARLQARFDDLSWINRLSPEFRELEGALNADVHATGTLGQPVLDGQVELNLPQIYLVTPGITLTDLQARLQARPGELANITARATAGSGTLAVDGTVALDSDNPDLILTITGDEAQLVDLADARVWVSPDLEVRFAGRRLDVTGRVDVPRATLTPRGFEGGLAPSSDQVIIRADATETSSLLELHANVTVALGDKVSFDGFGLKSKLSGQINARQSPGRSATGRGEIRLVSGRYQAYGQDLSIETGRLLFTGGPITDPAIEIRATRAPRDDIEVGVSVRGRLDAPEFALFSSPGMPQDQQLSWLILGRDLSASGGGDDQAALAGAALSLGLSGSDFLAQRLKGNLRIDDISIGARPGEDAEAAKITIGKYLSPKLYVSYGVGLFQPGHIFRLLYDIGRGFKLQTETGVASGADLLYTIER
ncbi:translocation/assembly module TamB domain-containing protein [Flagellatimonas centrodinii]|uniref:translocation/assembly module TamB domain-containing protein n=1 Tax=Flagellatimonas centrodinii TaxID=2806210 RepID=UPI001FEFCC83|nr:translocation/assembly module TamB domain-containing protein [Flagellatimonas centrodinii]ULQ47124.1 translocation/assembly module TamB domain-containing protein [Flagellatimonas centrodinii]